MTKSIFDTSKLNEITELYDTIFPNQATPQPRGCKAEPTPEPEPKPATEREVWANKYALRRNWLEHAELQQLEEFCAKERKKVAEYEAKERQRTQEFWATERARRAADPEPEPQHRIDFEAQREYSQYFERKTPQTHLQQAQAYLSMLDDPTPGYEACIRLVELHTALAQAEALTRIADALEEK